MKINTTSTTLILSFIAFITLNSQVPNYQMPPGMKEQMEKMQKQALKNAGIETDESSLTSFVKKLKTIKIGEDTPDDVTNLLGKPFSRAKSSGIEQLIYISYSNQSVTSTGVTSTVQIGSNGKVCCIKVTKSGSHGTEDIFVKGTWEMPGMAGSPSQSPPAKDQASQSDHFPLKDAAPDNPTEGQIYFNKTEKHFYGWNGNSWLKLDTKP